jgi:hypothetical protein
MSAMDRKANNDRLTAIIQEHREPSGAISGLDVPRMVNRLTALLDELVEAAYAEGFEEARQEG